MARRKSKVLKRKDFIKLPDGTVFLCNGEPMIKTANGGIDPSDGEEIELDELFPDDHFFTLELPDGNGK